MFTVVTERHSELSRSLWEFDFHVGEDDSPHFYLECYQEQIRKSKRHVWKVKSTWRRILSSPKRKPQVPENIIEQARTNLFSSLKLE